MDKNFQEQIREKLEGLSLEKVNLFAWLCMVRALPFLGAGGNFKYWKEDKRQKHLLSVLRAIDVVAVSATDTYAASAAIAALDAYGAIVRDSDAYGVISDVVAVAVYAIDAITDTSIFIFTSAAEKASTVAEYCNVNLKPILLQDLDMLINGEHSFNNDTSLYGEIWDNFQNALRNIGCEYWGNWYTKLFAKGFKLENEDCEEIRTRLDVRDAVKEAGASTVVKYIADLKIQGKKETKEARIILLGTKGAGKTSLATKLQDEDAGLPEKDESTAGVETLKLDLIPGETTHLWDFGGHVIVQAAHKCFMSAECVYVLVVDGRTEQQKDMDYFRKWLTTVKTYSKGSAKVFIILNVSDPYYAPIPKEKIKEEFPNLIEGYYTFNFKVDKDTLRDFKEHIKDYIETKFTRPLPKQYFKVKQEIERIFKEYNQEILSQVEVKEIATRFDLKNDSQGALDFLNILGVALRYDNIPGLVLNPSWISNGIYTIINHMENNGMSKIHQDDIPKIFEDKEASRYHLGNCEHLYKLMVKFELAFTANDEPGVLFVPAVFPINKLAGVPHPKPEEETLARRYRFEITLSESIFPRYIQRNHRYIKRNESGERFMCRDEMCLIKNNTYAIVTKESREIKITVWGEDKSTFLQELHNGLSDLLEEHWSQWERDEIKLPKGYYAAKVIRELYNDGVKKVGGEKIKDTIKKYNIFSIINIHKVEKIQAQAGLVTANTDLDITGFKSSKTKKFGKRFIKMFGKSD